MTIFTINIIRRDNLKRVSTILIIFVVVAFLFIWHIKANPPLHISGWGTTDYPDKHGITVEINNNGITSLKLYKVYINENEIPEVAELGISKTFCGVQMGTPSENEKRGISFHKLDELQVKKDLTPEQKQKMSQDTEVIKSYAVWVQNFNKPINDITIQYRYLDIPFTLHKSLKQ